jgi:predicted porin
VILSGGLNAFYVQNKTGNRNENNVVAGGIANANGQDSASVQNGLLPSNFSVSIKTVQRGYDVGATFGLYPGLNSVSGNGGANSAGNPRGLGTSGIDFRQQFITVGTPTMGTFKGGRDIGLFGAQAILNDFSLLSVGTPGNVAAPSNTSFGRIGLGYVYTDFQPQITYTSPAFSGLTASIGVFTPLDAVNFSGESGTLEAHNQPGFQGQLIYDREFGSTNKAKVWTSFVTQKLESDGGGDALPKGQSVRARGFDLGGKLTLGPAALVLYGYTGKALGSTGLFFDAVSESGDERDSYGGYIQGTYQFMERFTLGASWGASYLDHAGDEDNDTNPLLVEVNKSYLFGLRYQLTDWVQLAGEYIHTKSEAHGGNSADQDTFAIGANLFF